MPVSAPKPCNYPACGKLVHNASYCELHQKAKRKIVDDRRGSSTERGYGYRWQQVSKAFLKAHPICECDDCKVSGVLLPSQVVDHIIPHKGDMQLFWSRANWQAMNKKCHDKKTAKEDGGFGRG
jgi:5-methylcytosine-specific restriction protein A